MTLRNLWDRIIGMAETPETQPALHESADFQEFKSRKRDASSADVKPATPVEPPTPSGPQGESATASEAVVSQESKTKEEKPPRGDAESRIRDLVAENARLRAAQAQPAAALVVQARAEQPPAQPPARPTDTDQEPDADTFMRKAATEHPEYSYEKLIQLYNREYREWSGREQERQQQARANETKQQERVRLANEARQKHPDIDAVLFQANTLQVQPPTAQYLFDLGAEGLEIAYHVCKEPGEAARIAAMPWAEQISELAHIRRSIANPQSKDPEPPQPAARPIIVSRAPKPPRVLEGISASEPVTPQSFQEFRTLKRKA